MSEITQGSLAALAMFLTVISAWIQMLGGRPNGRIFYRLFFPMFFSTAIIVVSLISDNFSLSLLLVIPYYLLITHLGHTKLHERLFECCLYGLPAFFFGLGWYQMVLCVIAALIGHFFNKKPAPKVEMLVNFLRIVLVGYGVS